MGFISAHHAEILYNNALINIHTLEAARNNGVKSYLYTSSACVYPEYLQTEADVVPLKEQDAYPAQPQDAYGWEKLITERLCMHYREDYGIDTRIVRFHNIFGPLGTWTGGREKAPAAMCRKVAMAKLAGKRRNRDLGRRRTNPIVLLHRRLCRRHLSLMQSDYRSHSIWVRIAWSRSISWRASSRRLPESRSLATLTAPRACADATPTIPALGRFSIGSRKSLWRTE